MVHVNTKAKNSKSGFGAYRVCCLGLIGFRVSGLHVCVKLLLYTTMRSKHSHNESDRRDASCTSCRSACACVSATRQPSKRRYVAGKPRHVRIDSHFPKPKLGSIVMYQVPDPREDPKSRSLNGGSYKVPLVV